MKKNEVEVGGVYSAKVSGNIVPVRIDRENPRGGWEGTNLKTKKSVRIKSAQRLRCKAATWPGKKVSPEDAKAVHAADQENARLAEQRAGSADGQTASERAMTQSSGAAPRAKKATKATKDAKHAAKRDTGERVATGGEPDAKPMSLLDAAAHLLSLGTGDPMRCKDIVDLAVQRNLWTPGKGKTPASTLYAAIHREIKTKGDASRFRKAERGKFELAK